MNGRPQTLLFPARAVGLALAAASAVLAAVLVIGVSAEHIDSVTLDGYEVTFDGATDNGNGTSTWTYTITGTDGEGVQALSHWVLGLDLCADAGVVSASPGVYQLGVDPTTGVDGIKWEQSLEPDESRTYSVTIDAALGVDVFVGHTAVAVKAGHTGENGTINGPDCTIQPGETPTQQPTEQPTQQATQQATPSPSAALGETTGPRALPATGQSDSDGSARDLPLLMGLGGLLLLGGAGSVAVVAVRRRR